MSLLPCVKSIRNNPPMLPVIVARPLECRWRHDFEPDLSRKEDGCTGYWSEKKLASECCNAALMFVPESCTENPVTINGRVGIREMPKVRGPTILEMRY